MIRLKDYLTDYERKIFSFILIMLFLGLLVNYLNLTGSDNQFSGELDSLITRQQLIDIRSADQTELETLPRIGPALSKRIIEYRNQNQFKSSEELINIKGIGPKTMETIRVYLVQFGEVLSNTDSTKSHSDLIDINLATESELISLPGIGKIKAKRIIDKRKELGKFSSCRDLIEVKGIGEKTLAKLMPYIKCKR